MLVFSDKTITEKKFFLLIRGILSLSNFRKQKNMSRHRSFTNVLPGVIFVSVNRRNFIRIVALISHEIIAQAKKKNQNKNEPGKSIVSSRKYYSSKENSCVLFLQLKIIFILYLFFMFKVGPLDEFKHESEHMQHMIMRICKNFGIFI